MTIFIIITAIGFIALIYSIAEDIRRKIKKEDENSTHQNEELNQLK